MSKVKKLTLSSVLLGSVMVCLCLASAFPVMSLTLIAIASIVTYAALIECQMTYSLLLYVAASILGFLIVPDKSCVIMYTFLFGAYPFIKHISEKLRFKALRWVIKILCVNALIFALYFLFKSVLLSFVPGDFLLVFAYLIFNFVFITFDICITRLKAFYMWRVHRRII